jgi:hypothetical protein
MERFILGCHRIICLEGLRKSLKKIQRMDKKESEGHESKRKSKYEIWRKKSEEG